jgi:hypothetical protein
MELDMELGSKVFGFFLNVLKLEPKGLEIERIMFKPPPKKSPNKFYSVKVNTKGLFYFNHTILAVLRWCVHLHYMCTNYPCSR